jgi:hypothetical protein
MGTYDLIFIGRRSLQASDNNIKMELRGIRYEYVNWVGLVEDLNNWGTTVNALRNIRFPQNQASIQQLNNYHLLKKDLVEVR